MRDTMASLIVNNDITNTNLKKILADETPDSFYVECLPPSHDEERSTCFNRILGMNKVSPIVALQHDPVTRVWCERSHHQVTSSVMKNLNSFEDIIGYCRWFDIELASFRGVAIDRFHLATSVATPLWEIGDDDELYAVERNDANRNIPAILLRRILRAEIHSGPGCDRLLQHFIDDTKLCETATSPELLSDHDLWFKHQLVDLQWLLAPFCDTLRYLFPDGRVENVSESILRVLGNTKSVYEAHSIAKPLADTRLMDAIENLATSPTTVLPLLLQHYQIYTTLLWRLVKAHQLMNTVEKLIERADRTVFNIAYSYNTLKIIDYYIQLFIDTHLWLFCWAEGDRVWTDAAFYGGPGADVFVKRDHGDDSMDIDDDGMPIPFPKHLDIGSHSPLFIYYPHCRDVHPCESELPDISSLIPIGNNTQDINVKPSNPPLGKAMVHIIGCKLGPHRCQIRNFAKILLRYMHGREPKDNKTPFVGYSSLKQYILLVIRCGLLGNWKMASTRAKFSERVALEYSFLPIIVPTANGLRQNINTISPHQPDYDLFGEDGVGTHPTRLDFTTPVEWNWDDAFTTWITENDTLCFALLKEYYVNMFEYNMTLDIEMSRYAQWGRYKCLMRASMDNVRAFINTRGGSATVLDKNWWAAPLTLNNHVREESILLYRNIRDILKTFHRMAKRCFIKLSKDHFFRMLLRHMNLAMSMRAAGETPSGHKRCGLAGDDDAEMLASAGFTLSSTRDVMQPLPIKEGEAGEGDGGGSGGKGKGKRKRAVRNPRGAGPRGRKRKSGGDDDDDDDDDEDDEEEEEEEEEDEDEDDESDAHLLNRPESALMDSLGPERAEVLLDDSVIWDGTALLRAAEGANGGNSTSATRGAIGGGLDDDDEANSASDRNLAAIAKQMAIAARDVTDVDFDLMDLVTRDMMRRRQTTWRFETRWLVELFGVSEDTASRLRSIYSYYEAFDMPDYQLLERTYAIYMRNPRDFYVMRVMLCMALWHGSQLFIPLSQEVRQAQLVAVRERWRIPEWKDLPRDLGWAYYCAGSRRWFTTEAGIPRQKIDTSRDRANYLRDIRNELIATGKAPEYVIREAKMLQTLQISRVLSSMQHIEKLSERVYSINMERTTYDDVTGQLYARRKKDPSLRRLKAAAALASLQDGANETDADLMMDGDGASLAQEANAALAEDDEEINIMVKKALGPKRGGGNGKDGLTLPNDPMEVDGDDDDALRKIFEENAAKTKNQLDTDDVLVSTDDITIYIDRDTGRQYGWLSDAMRHTYRTSVPASSMLYDSSCNDPLIAVDMIGVIRIMNDKAYVLCTKCLTITQFDNGKCGNTGPDCGLHDEHALFKHNRRFLMYNARAMTPPSISFDKLLYGNANQQTETVKSMIMQEQDIGLVECHFCARIGRLAGQMANVIKKYRFLRRSKRDGTVVVETLGVCDRDARYAGHALQGRNKDEGIEYDAIENAIRQGRINAMFGGTSRKRMLIHASGNNADHDDNNEREEGYGD